MAIYKITNKIDGKSYIGQTVADNPNVRIKYHFQKFEPYHVSYIWKAIQKYGKDNFEVSILDSSQDPEKLNELEEFYINQYNTLRPNGYNLKAGGLQGGKCSEETRRRISEMKKGKPGRGKAAKGVPKSIEHRKKMSEVRKGFTSPARKAAHARIVEKSKKPIEATNIKTGEILKFSSVTECAETLKLIPTCIVRTIIKYKNENRTQHKGWKFRFLEKEEKKNASKT